MFFLGEKILFCGQDEVLQVLEKIDLQNFSDFLYKVTVAYQLIIDLSDIFGKNLVLRFLDQKLFEMGPKWCFSGIIESNCLELS